MVRYLVACLSAAVVAGASPADDLNAANEAALAEVVRSAAPWVVKIETSGGRETVGGGGGGPGGGGAGVRKGVGPTTGVVVDPDGYILSSAFNFANKPSSITVIVPGKGKSVARVVATDTTRMLTLLKVDLTGLPVPAAVPKTEFRIGQWALALGRALDTDISDPPSVSVGIVSATGRIWGKAVQTDAKVSPVNYGGPLVAVDGRVLGVLIPASPEGEGDTAGVEWYDSGIGFAVPFEDVLAALPRLKKGRDLRRGLLGITPKAPDDTYNSAMTINTVSPDSTAARAGIKSGDTIVRIDGKPIANFSQLQHALGPKYEGDPATVTVSRDGKEMAFENLVLSGAVTAYTQPFLGILPMRDDTAAGVEVRYVYPKSPAAAAKLVAGDRVLKVGPAAGGEMVAVPNRGQFAALVGRFAPGTAVTFEVKRAGGKTETLSATLAAAGDDIPDKLPGVASKKQIPDAAPKPKPKPPADGGEAKDGADKPADKDEPETGLLKRTDPTLGREYWVYVPRAYKKGVAHGVLVWLHAAGKGGKDADDVVGIWGAFCEDNQYILVGPRSKNPEGWVASEADEVVQDVRTVLGQYNVDRTRVAAHGMGVGGQMAYYLGFAARDVFRGVATTGAALGTKPKDTTAGQPLAFFVVAGEKDPLLIEIMDARDQLAERKYPVVYRQIREFGKEYLDTAVLKELESWLDALDRI